MSDRPPDPCRLLFLCTGNYYRSRFAEVLFNQYAADAGLAWNAFSRGIATDFGIHNVGPMSRHAMRGLAARGIELAGTIRFPAQVREPDLQEADLIVALKESEHRPLLQERYPAWPDRVEYWDVDDLDRAAPEGAMAEIEQGVRELLERLARNHRGCKEAVQG